VDVERRAVMIVAGAAVLLGASMAMAAGTAATPAPSPGAAASVGVAERPEGEPIFFRWLDKSDPVDATILDYWQRYRSGELSPREMVDLGTMLYRRGWPKDAVRLYVEAGKTDPVLYDAWLRAGLAEHSQHNLGAAKKYYKKCLKILVGSGWCNFYLGLAEEQSFNGAAALKYYGRAFKVDPGLADMRTNPAVLQSKIARAAAIVREHEERFSRSMPLSYLEPEEVEKTRAKFAAQQRKIEMWEAQEAAKEGARPRTPQRRAQPVPRSGVPSKTRGASPPAAGGARGTTPQGGTAAPPRRRPPGSTVPHVPTPGPKATQAPAPAGTANKRYPWGGGPLPHSAGPQDGTEVPKTPLPRPTPRPTAK